MAELTSEVDSIGGESKKHKKNKVFKKSSGTQKRAHG
jgi:hypothetical protein